MRLKNFQLVLDEQSLVRIKPDSLCCETKTVRRLRTHVPPTDAARMLHTTTHVPFRDWCPFCVVSRGRSFPHRRVVMNKTADILPKFQTDYMFIRTVEESVKTVEIVLRERISERMCEQIGVRWHRARDVGAISAKGSQSGDRINCEVKCRSTGKRLSQLQSGERRRGSNRSLRLGAASIQPFLSNMFQRESRRHDSSFHWSKCEPTTENGVQHQPAPATAVHQVPGTRIHDLCGRCL